MTAEHTPAPWSTGGIFYHPLGGHQNIWGPTPPGLASGDRIAEKVALANARRIVACVNYCEGVKTLEIESAPKHLQLRHLLAMIDNDLPIALAKLGDKS